MKALKTASIILLFLLAAGNVFGQRATLTIHASEGPAQVILDGRLLGVANPNFRAQVAPGTYDLLVRKPGLPEFRQRITVGPAGLTVDARLGAAPPPPPPVNHTLQISGNVSGAEIFLNNARVGTVPYRQTLFPGQYTLRVTAPGYQEYSTTIHLAADQNVSVTLLPMSAAVNVSIPPHMLNSGISNPASRIELYIDGNRISGLSAQVQPGRRQIRIVSGGFAFETTINTRPGGSYLIEPAMTLQVR